MLIIPLHMMAKCNLLNANSVSRLGLKLQYMSNFKLTVEIEVPFSNEPADLEKFPFSGLSDFISI